MTVQLTASVARLTATDVSRYSHGMPDRSRNDKQPRDINELAASIVEDAVGDVEVGSGAVAPTKNPHAAALGRLGGKKGGPARAKKLTPEQRRAIAQKAAQVRWSRDFGA